MEIPYAVPVIGDDEGAAYGLAVKMGGLTAERIVNVLGWGQERAERVMRTLREVRLVKACPVRAGVWVAVNPDTAKAQYTKPIEGLIDAWRSQVDGIREQLAGLADIYTVGCGTNHNGVIVPIGDTSHLYDVLDETASYVTDEMLSIQPLGRNSSLSLEWAIRRDLALLRRNVKVRALFGHYARYDSVVAEYTERITEAGGEVRTVVSLLPGLVLFDRSAVVVTDGEDGYHMVQHKALVDFVAHAAEGAWASGTEFRAAKGGLRFPDSLTEETKAAIIQLLSAGYKDEVVAKRLGIALRTCRKHIAEILGEVGAQSRFQAGWLVRERAVSTAGL
ncbi:hypothetical protein [Streptomyces sp. NPDC001770]